MLISRIIQPIVWQPYSSQYTGGEFGFGDMSPTFFLSPARPGKLIWGVGPAWAFPTATNKLLGQGKVSVGPSVVALLQPGHWTLGALVNNVWSFAGSGSRPSVNQMLLQYFITYNLKKGWNVSSSPIITANWHNQAPLDAANGGDTTSGGRWTIPFGGGSRTHHPPRPPARQHRGQLLRQRRPPLRRLLLGPPHADRAPLSQESPNPEINLEQVSS